MQLAAFSQYLRRGDQHPVLKLTVGRRANELSVLCPSQTYPLTRMTEADRHMPAQLDFVELVAFLLTLSEKMNATVPTRDKRRIRGGNDFKYSHIKCSICKKVRYVVHCMSHGPLFTIGFLAGCPHLVEEWQEEMTEGQIRVFSLNCLRGWVRLTNGGWEPPICMAARPFGQWMLHQNFVPPESRLWVEALSYCPAGLHYLLLKRNHAVNLNDFIDSLPGYTMVRTLEDEHGAFYLYHGKALLSFTWIPPWAWSAWNLIKYIQLDCSFRASHPFVYSVPQRIIFNKAVPLALTVNVAENLDTY
jgi:hypothetical protein